MSRNSSQQQPSVPSLDEPLTAEEQAALAGANGNPKRGKSKPSSSPPTDPAPTEPLQSGTASSTLLDLAQGQVDRVRSASSDLGQGMISVGLRQAEELADVIVGYPEFVFQMTAARIAEKGGKAMGKPLSFADLSKPPLESFTRFQSLIQAAKTTPMPALNAQGIPALEAAAATETVSMS